MNMSHLLVMSAGGHRLRTTYPPGLTLSWAYPVVSLAEIGLSLETSHNW